MWSGTAFLDEKDFRVGNLLETQSKEKSEKASELDFLMELSSDLDIPLLLNQGEDETTILNNKLDSQIHFNDLSNNYDESSFLNDLLTGQVELFPELSTPELSPKSVDTVSDDVSDESNSSFCSNSSTPPRKTTTSITKRPKVRPSRTVTQSTKQVPIQPKMPAQFATVPVNNSNIVIFNNVAVDNFSANSYKPLTPPSSIVTNIEVNHPVLDLAIPVNSFTPLTSPNSIVTNIDGNHSMMDLRAFKRQQRRIKNRESASISRKKRKDYVSSLEEELKKLEEENKRLIVENKELKFELEMVKNRIVCSKSQRLGSTEKKASVFLLAFLFVMVVDVHLGRSFQYLLPSNNQSTFQMTNYQELPSHVGRTLLWTKEEQQEEDRLKNETYFSALTMCPASINQTESARLLLELERWIGGIEQEPIHKPPVLIKKSSTLSVLKRRRRVRFESLSPSERVELGTPQYEFTNEIQVFNPRGDKPFSEFFEAINRQDDTFYVVSFSEQHMLLPALHHNNTRRPKMTFLMPSMPANETSSQALMPLMQIDCEVLDTKMVNVKYGSIPTPYRGNSTRYKSKTTENGTHRKYDDAKKHNGVPKYALKTVLFGTP